MLQRLPYPDEKENPDPRGDLDRDLEVALWETPTTRRRYRDAPVATDGAPAWWHGDEEATDAFVRGMGIKSLDDLRR
jgi:hypothetical protein